MLLESDEGGCVRIPAPYLNNVVFLYTQRGGDMIPIGTAFHTGVFEGEMVHAYLVTARHVVERYLVAGEPVLARHPRTDTSLPNVGFGSLDGEWVFHEDAAVDVALFPYTQRHEDLVPGKDRLAITATDFDSVQGTPERLLEDFGHEIAVGDEVFFPGMFAKYHGHSQNLASVRFGRIALLTNEPLRSLTGGPDAVAEVLVIESQAYPGYSGSPLYVVLPPLPIRRLDGSIERVEPPTAKLIGVVAGYYPDEQTVLDQYGAKQFTHFGLSLAVPIERVRELIYSDKLQELRQVRAAGKPDKERREPA